MRVCGVWVKDEEGMRTAGECDDWRRGDDECGTLREVNNETNRNNQFCLLSKPLSLHSMK
jgi:hypothetical protein